MSTFDKNHVNIIAKDITEFNKLEESLIGLPDEIKKDLFSIENNLAGVICTFKTSWDKKIDVNIPKNVELIRHDGDVVSIYAAARIFRIPVTEGSEINYTFV